MKINAKGDLEDSYTYAIGQLSDLLGCTLAIFLDDGSYISLWSSMSNINAYGVSSDSMLYKA